MPHKLLLADDSVTIQKVIELTFADEDIEVIAVSNGREAIERAPLERPDIVLADVGMPERDGYEVAAFIKRRPDLKHIPVLLLTGAFEPIDEGRAKAAGCDGVLVKPFEPQMVITRVKDLIAGKRPTAGTAAPSYAPPPAPPPSTPANEYFDRLDAVFASETPIAPAAAAPSSIVAEAPAAATAPAVADPPAAAAPPFAKAGEPVSTNAETPAAGPSASAPTPTLAEAFAALLAAEQGRVVPPPPISEQALRDDVVEEVTRRVIERMTDGAVREVALEVAERVVREEIERIKTQSR